MEIKNRFKIHALSTVNSTTRNCNNKFYDSYDEAEKAASSYARNGAAMVIYEARAVVAPPEAPPVVITPLESTIRDC